VLLQESASVKRTQDATLDGPLHFAPVLGREPGGLMEADPTLRLLAEHAVDDEHMDSTHWRSGRWGST
jgi:hypothetical protein